jgi:Fe-S cluster assembly protein SufD
VRLERDARLEHFALDLGGDLTRNDLAIDIVGTQAEATLNGLYLAGPGQHVDNHTRTDHRVGPARSRQDYRGVLAGRCRAIWNGKAIVHRGADGTDAQQSNHNLLLSEQAEIDAKPELEIYADDVKCAHGTTVGQLDERALYYLRTRGIGTARARRILTRAFATTVVNTVPVAALRDLIGTKVEARLRAIDAGEAQ